MRRREFLTTSCFTLAHLIHPAIAHSNPLTRAAIVIGVNKSGNLPVLSAAALDATRIASWLLREGFKVFTFIDDSGPVKRDAIFEAVDKIIDRGIYDQLVVYFSGHGFFINYTEVWMLSGAPHDSSQAISLLKCKVQSKLSGIPNVVFISDSCRSAPGSVSLGFVDGVSIFPAKNSSGNVTTKVDTFLATQIGDPALEADVDKSVPGHQGIYTETFLNAFTNADDSMISEVNDVPVILNKDLEGFLNREVPRLAQKKSITLDQRPDTEVLSNNYIGRFTPPSNRIPEPPPESVATISQVTDQAFKQIGLWQDTVSANMSTSLAIQNLSDEVGFEAARIKVLAAAAEAPETFESQTGFSVSGAVIVEAYATWGMDIELLTMRPGDTASLVRLWPRSRQAASVVLRFSDGTGTVVAGLAGYIGTIVVDDGRIVSINYSPASNAARWGPGDEEQLKELRALVSTSARFGTFRIGGRGGDQKERAEQLADRIRVLKSVDPTLGVYAAYAYVDADEIDQVRSVWEIMRYDLQAEIFDVAMLAEMLGGKAPGEEENLVPFCPMLSLGWEYIGLRGVNLYPEVEQARKYTRQALWTTFETQGMEILVNAIKSGKFDIN